MLIKDLEMTKELSGKDLAAVRGGLNFAAIGGPVQQANQAQVSGGGFSLVGPIAISAPTQVFVPTITQTDTDVDLNLASLTNVLGLQNTGLLQI